MPSRIPLAELARLPNFYVPTASWSGDKIAFYWDKTGRMELYVLELRTREVHQISHGEVPRALRAGFAWDRTDASIVFAKDQDGNEQHDLYAINVKTSAVKQLTHDPTCIDPHIFVESEHIWYDSFDGLKIPAINVRAKLLMVHGANDPRCPVEQSRLFHDRLLELGRSAGVDFEYVEFTDEGHGSTDIEQKIRTYQLLADYMQRQL